VARVVYVAVRATGVVHLAPFYPRPVDLRLGERVIVITQCGWTPGVIAPDGTVVTCLQCLGRTP